jgi:hypothetical protein
MQARLQSPARRHPIALMILTSLVMGACSAAPSVSPTATPSPTASAVTSCTVITKDEAATVLGLPVTGAFEGEVDITATLQGCGFSPGTEARLGVAVAENGRAQFEQIKASTPNSTPLPGVGDEAFAADEGGSGVGPFLVGSLKGGTAVYIFLQEGTATQFEAMKTLLATAVSRI